MSGKRSRSSSSKTPRLGKQTWTLGKAPNGHFQHPENGVADPLPVANERTLFVGIKVPSTGEDYSFDSRVLKNAREELAKLSFLQCEEQEQGEFDVDSDSGFDDDGEPTEFRFWDKKAKKGRSMMVGTRGGTLGETLGAA